MFHFIGKLEMASWFKLVSTCSFLISRISVNSLYDDFMSSDLMNSYVVKFCEDFVDSLVFFT